MHRPAGRSTQSHAVSAWLAYAYMRLPNRLACPLGGGAARASGGAARASSGRRPGQQQRRRRRLARPRRSSGGARLSARPPVAAPPLAARLPRAGARRLARGAACPTSCRERAPPPPRRSTRHTQSTRQPRHWALGRGTPTAGVATRGLRWRSRLPCAQPTALVHSQCMSYRILCERSYLGVAQARSERHSKVKRAKSCRQLLVFWKM